jgi:hypothetical protein
MSSCPQRQLLIMGDLQYGRSSIGLTQELDEIMEKTVIGSISKTKSITMLWEEVKDLSVESIHELQSTLCDL